ncbi:MAG: AAA family ATPase, partial [Bacteroidota bacterium]
MIQSLSISNFALIEKLHIDFSSGFSIITGETGAGKSILLGALGMVLGKRADLNSLKNKGEKCVIEAQFRISNYGLKSFFENNDLDYDELTILRREVLPSGKSRAFINDTPVNLNELQELSDALIDIHSQHQTSDLTENNYQFLIIDAIANNTDLLTEYSAQLKNFKSEETELRELKTKLSDLLKDQDYTAFLLDELQSIPLKTINQTELEDNFEQLNNVEFIKENLSKSILIANDEQHGIFHLLNEMKTSLQKVTTFSEHFQQLFERVHSVDIELKDAIDDLVRKEADLIDDPESLRRINEQLQLLYNLQKKHQVETAEELVEIQKQLENKVHAFGEIENSISNLEKSIKENELILNELASKIHNNRESAIPIL